MTSHLKASTARTDSCAAKDHLESERRALLEAVFQRHAPLVRRYAARRLPLEDVDDAVSETFAAAWRKIADCPEDDAQHLWLLGIARGLVANVQRGNGRRRALRALLVRQPAEPDYIPDTGSELVRAAMRKLPQPQQEVLRLALWEELAHADIAQILGCSPNAVAVRLSRARSRLRDALIDVTYGRPNSTGSDAVRFAHLSLAAGSDQS